MMTSFKWVRLVQLAGFLHLSCISAVAVSFESDIRPIFKTHCFHCHGEGGKTKGDLDVRLKRLLLQGGKHGPAISPGQAEVSLLFQKVRNGKMPKGQARLSGTEIELIRAWIAQGAKTLRPEPENPSDLITEEERRFWAFQPIKPPPVPNGSNNPIDAFLLKRLKNQGMGFSPQADKRSLIRRATYDLTGLPPTPKEIQTFLEDETPRAYAKLIDRLLASPQYGERWGRHWLDAAGYADSEGYTESDAERGWAWRYRDYVVRAFNDDMPWDRFIREQIAGDEMVKPTYTDLNSVDIDKLVATGYLRMAPDGTGSGAPDQPLARNQVIADTLKIVSTSLMGLTIGCAQCHNHRYDPILQSDYYKLRAIFEPALNPQNWRTPQNRRISLLTENDRKKRADIEAEAKKLDAERQEKVEFFIDRTLKWKLEAEPKELRGPLRTAYRTPDAKRTDEQKALLKAHPSIRQISAGSLYLYDREYQDEINKASAELKRKQGEFIANVKRKTLAAASVETRARLEASVKSPEAKRSDDQRKLLAEYPGALVDEHTLGNFDAIAAEELQRLADRALYFQETLSKAVLDAMAKKATDLRATKPEEQFIRALTEQPDKVPVTRVFYRGSHDQPRAAVKPADLTVVSLKKNPIPENEPTLPSTGRRLAFAKRLTDGTHPLTARVLVNRFWLHHFGRGMVDTPGDFGKLGELPSHPELLDWMAGDFIKNGWHLKRLHRLIMISQAYRQTSRRTPSLDEVDPDNRLLGRMNVRRLEAETIRDSILFLSGRLNPRMYGKPVPVMEDEVGQFVVGVNTNDSSNRPTGKTISLGVEENRRSLYVQVRRSRVLSFIDAFDAPTMEPNCIKRPTSIVAPQALLFMNNDFVISQSQSMAERFQRVAGDNLDAQLSLAWETTLGQAASSDDVARSRAFVERQTAVFEAQKEKQPRLASLANFCQALLSSNAFINID